MNARFSIALGLVLLAANPSVLGQVFQDFDDTNPGTVADPEPIGGGIFLLVPPTDPTITLEANYAGSVYVERTGDGLAEVFGVKFEQVLLTLDGPGLPAMADFYPTDLFVVE